MFRPVPIGRLRSLILRFSFVLLLGMFAGAVCGAQTEALNNDSVIQMSKAGLGDGLIIQSINMTPSKFSTSVNDMIALKQAGVSDRVIEAMVAKNAAPATKPLPNAPETRQKLDMPPPAPSPAPPVVPADFSMDGVDELGVYYKAHDGKWVLIEPEILNFREGGALKSYSTDHLIKQDKNGHLIGPSSPLALTRSTPILLYMPAGMSPLEYLLIRFRPGAQKSREFRSETGGMFHGSTGAARDQVQFSGTRISKQVYTFNLPDDVGKGEYGILPPTQGGNAGYGGKIFTFKIIE